MTKDNLKTANSNEDLAMDSEEKAWYQILFGRDFDEDSEKGSSKDDQE